MSVELRVNKVVHLYSDKPVTICQDFRMTDKTRSLKTIGPLQPNTRPRVCDIVYTIGDQKPNTEVLHPQKGVLIPQRNTINI